MLCALEHVGINKQRKLSLPTLGTESAFKKIGVMLLDKEGDTNPMNPLPLHLPNCWANACECRRIQDHQQKLFPHPNKGVRH